MSTIKDVAKIANVAPSTVSSVLNQRITVRPGTYQKIMDAIEKTGYRANSIARGLRMKETQTLGLVLPTILNPHYPQVAHGVEEYAGQRDYHVFLCNTERSSEKIHRHIHALVNKGIDGIIFYNTEVTPEDFKFLKNQNVAVVTNYPVKAEWIDEVRINLRGAAKQMNAYLLSLGHRRIALINGEKSQFRSKERLIGMRAAFREAGVVMDESLVFYSDYSQQFAYECARKFLSTANPPTCVFTTDHMAVAVLNAAFELRMRVPEDLSVAGFDQAVSIYPSLTTTQNSSEEVGRLLAEMAIQRCQADEKPKKKIITVPSRIFVGKSTASPCIMPGAC